MKNQQGFSLVELLIVVAIIAIIAAIAVPSLLTSRMATNEAAAIQGCRTVGTAEIAFAATNNQSYTDMPTLIAQNFLDSRFATGINGYSYTAGQPTGYVGGITPATGGFGFVADSNTGAGRYMYSIAPDQVVRYEGTTTGAPQGTVAPTTASGVAMVAGDLIGKK